MRIPALILILLISFTACDDKKTGSETDDTNISDNEAISDDDAIIADEDTDETFTDSDAELVCGNSVVEGDELCDGGTIECTELDAERYVSGTATCSNDCSDYDTGECVRACYDGQTRCEGSVLQNCVERLWENSQDCEELKLLCLPSGEQEGYMQAYECRELGIDNSCAVVLSCFSSCGDDSECTESCEESGTEAAKQYFDALLTCGEENCEGVSDTSCLRNSCRDEYRACRNDPGVVCGNGFVEGSEECDDGNLSNLDGCSEDCLNETPGTCGNGVVESGEKCDDGNLEAGDGCDDSCMFEYGDYLDFEGPDYTGDSLLIINVSPYSDNMAGTGPMPAYTLKNTAVSPVSSGTGFSDLFINPHFKVPEGLTNDDLYRPMINLLPTVGDTKTFFVINGAGTAYEEITATLMRIGKHVQIWCEDTDFATESQIQDLADEFDNVIYPLVTENFAEPSDINEDGTITLLFTDLGLSIAGYFSPGDLYSSSTFPQSNERDMIFVSTRNALTNKGAYAVIAHEFQHLCYNNQNAIIENDAQGINDNANTWINEGMSMTAMHLYNGIQSDWIGAYNQSASITKGQSLTDWNDSSTTDVYGDYALSYLFFEYLRIQGNNETGMFKEIIEDESNDYRCVEHAIRKYVGEGLSFSDFNVLFRLALLLNEDTGTFGFGGEEGFNLTEKYYTGTEAVDLQGTGAIFREIDGSYTEPDDKSAIIKYVGITTK